MLFLRRAHSPDKKKQYYQQQQQQQQQKKKDEALFKQTELNKAANSIN